jgi:hypothetical protein
MFSDLHQGPIDYRGLLFFKMYVICVKCSSIHNENIQLNNL